MTLVAVGEFKNVRFAGASANQLMSLDRESRSLVEHELERLRQLGPMRIYQELHAYKPISFVEGVKTVGFFVVGKILGVVEILRRHLQLVALVHSNWLTAKDPNEVVTLWRRTATRNGYLWRAQLLIDHFNRMTFVQFVCHSKNLGLPNRKGKAWGYHVFWGQGLFLGELAPMRTDAVIPEDQSNYRTACEALGSLARI